MSRGADIAHQALAAGLLLSRKGAKIHIDSPLGHPLPEDLRRQLLEHKQEVLAYLDFCERADAMLLAVSERIAAGRPAGCPLEGEAWRAAAQDIDAAHASEHLPAFCEALIEYEHSANEQFSFYRAHHRDTR